MASTQLHFPWFALMTLVTSIPTPRIGLRLQGHALISTLLSALLLSNALALDRWCGKPYRAGSSAADVILPPPQAPKDFQIGVSVQPLIDGQDEVARVLLRFSSWKKEKKEKKEKENLTLECSVETANGSLLLISSPWIGQDSADLLLTSLPSRRLPYSLTCHLNSEAPLSVRHVAETPLAYLPLTHDQSTVKLNLPSGRMTYYSGGDSDAPVDVFPYGFYATVATVFEDVPTRLREMVDAGHTMVHLNPPYEIYNMTLFFDWCDALGLLVVFDFRYTWQNTSHVLAQVERYKNRRSLAFWYTADEPDGTGDPVQDLTDLYHKIKLLDPYHPVMLNLNCLRWPAVYQSAADVLTTDPYPVSMDPDWSSEWGTLCNSTYGCCGCDDCTGKLRDVYDRFVVYREILEPVAAWKPVWAVLQGFGGGQYWPRAPHGDEIAVMVALSVVSGVKGIFYWCWKTFPDVEDAVKASAESVKEWGDMLMHGEAKGVQLSQGCSLFAGSWALDGRRLLILVNAEEESATCGVQLGTGTPVVPQLSLGKESVLECGRELSWDGAMTTVLVNGTSVCTVWTTDAIS